MTRIVFALVALTLAVLAAGLLLYSGRQIWALWGETGRDAGEVILASIGYTIIALAVFEVSKYIMEEEVMHPSEMSFVRESRRGMTKFISTIAIAVFLEALVMVFSAGNRNIEDILYPTFLIFAGVSMVVGLGVYQRLSARAELDVEHERIEPRPAPPGEGFQDEERSSSEH